MRVNITPIRADEVEATTLAFFTPEFVSQQLGQPGNWQGDECERMKLKGVVDKPILDHVLNGNSPSGSAPAGGNWRGERQPVGWKITFDLDWRHNTLWAVGDGEVRDLARFSHVNAVRTNLDMINQVVRRAAGFGPTDRVGAVFAVFESGTSEGQVPALRSTVIVPQGHLRDDGSVMTFPSRIISGCGPRLNQTYLCELIPREFHAFGSIGAPTAASRKDCSNHWPTIR